MIGWLLLLFLFHFWAMGLISYCLHRKISLRQTWSRGSWILPSAISNESQQQLHQQRSTHQGSFNVTFLFKCVNISVFLHPSCILDTSGSILLHGFPILLWGFFGLFFWFDLFYIVFFKGLQLFDSDVFKYALHSFSSLAVSHCITIIFFPLQLEWQLRLLCRSMLYAFCKITL